MIRRNNKGIIIITVFVLLMALLIMVGGYYRLIFYKAQLHSRDIELIKSYYIAIAGVKYIRRLATNQRMPDESIEFFVLDSDKGKVTVDSVTSLDALEGTNLREITSTGELNGIERTIVCTIIDEEGYHSKTAYSKSYPIIKWK